MGNIVHVFIKAHVQLENKIITDGQNRNARLVIMKHIFDKNPSRVMTPSTIISFLKTKRKETI